MPRTALVCPCRPDRRANRGTELSRPAAARPNAARGPAAIPMPIVWEACVEDCQRWRVGWWLGWSLARADDQLEALVPTMTSAGDPVGVVHPRVQHPRAVLDREAAEEIFRRHVPAGGLGRAVDVLRRPRRDLGASIVVGNRCETPGPGAQFERWRAGGGGITSKRNEQASTWCCRGCWGLEIRRWCHRHDPAVHPLVGAAGQLRHLQVMAAGASRAARVASARAPRPSRIQASALRTSRHATTHRSQIISSATSSGERSPYSSMNHRCCTTRSIRSPPSSSRSR